MDSLRKVAAFIIIVGFGTFCFYRAIENETMMYIIVVVIGIYLVSWSLNELSGGKKPKSLIKLEAERMEWSRKTFPEATAVSSLLKLREEAKEIESDLHTGANPSEEYADAMMCLFDSAGRAGISLPSLIEAFDRKLQKNKSRKWIKNPDNTYSHKK